MHDIHHTEQTPFGGVQSNQGNGTGSFSNIPEYSVSDISNALKRTVEETYNFVRIRGEVSGFKCPSSGHWYFSLKDDSSVLSAVCWRGVTSRIDIRPQDGMEVVVTGKITTYGARSSYQIIIDSLEPAGEGALLKILEDRKKQLAQEGLFDTSRKKNIPTLPNVIGVITSPTGAVIKDILHRINDRFPRNVLLWGVPVQGQGAEHHIANAIDGFNMLSHDLENPNGIGRPDVIIIARGGGSLEDLWAFNEECVARAVANSSIPIISAIGHETDTTLIDFVADQRAPTPTAAAEMAVPVRLHCQKQVQDFQYRLQQSIRHGIEMRTNYMDTLSKGLPDIQNLMGYSEQRLEDTWGHLKANLKNASTHYHHQLKNLTLQLKSPTDIIAYKGQMLTNYDERLLLTTKQNLNRHQDTLSHIKSLLESYSYRNVLKRGFTIVRDTHGSVISSLSIAKEKDAVSVEFYDGATTLYPEKNKSPIQKKKRTTEKQNTPYQKGLF